MIERYKIKVYLKKETVEEVAILNDLYPNLNQVFRESSVFVLDMTEDELDEALGDTESDFAMFCNSYNIKTVAEPSVLKNMLANKADLIKNCRSLFIMDVDEQEAVKIQEECGVLVLSSNKIDDDVFNRKYWRHLFIKDATIQGSPISEWQNVLNEMSWLPMNSLILFDNYLFTGTDEALDNCVENVKGLLNAILPDHLGVDFHILILTKHPNCSENKRNKIVGNIKAFLETQKDYKIKLEVVFCESLHQRKIITNYNIMIGDKGFVNFNNKKKKIIDNNPTYACSVFQNMNCSVGDTEYLMATVDLENIYGISEKVKEMNNNDVNDPTKIIVGNGSSRKTINNRLLIART